MPDSTTLGTTYDERLNAMIDLLDGWVLISDAISRRLHPTGTVHRRHPIWLTPMCNHSNGLNEFHIGTFHELASCEHRCALCERAVGW